MSIRRTREVQFASASQVKSVSFLPTASSVLLQEISQSRLVSVSVSVCFPRGAANLLRYGAGAAEVGGYFGAV